MPGNPIVFFNTLIPSFPSREKKFGRLPQKQESATKEMHAHQYEALTFAHLGESRWHPSCARHSVKDYTSGANDVKEG
jgi:hypothetical protein